MSFAELLTSICTIQQKTLSTAGYEQTEAWTNVMTNVACRKDSYNSASIADRELRSNKDDDTFYFLASTTIVRGNRINLDGDLYDVIKVNKSYGFSGVHHLEVTARLVDHD